MTEKLIDCLLRDGLVLSVIEKLIDNLSSDWVFSACDWEIDCPLSDWVGVASDWEIAYWVIELVLSVIEKLIDCLLNDWVGAASECMVPSLLKTNCLKDVWIWEWLFLNEELYNYSLTFNAHRLSAEQRRWRHGDVISSVHLLVVH